MRKPTAYLVLALTAMLSGSACSGDTQSEATDATLASESVESYQIRGVIRERDLDTSSILFEHEAIPGYMGAMTMSFRVDDVNVGSLPPDGSTLEGTLNVAGVDYWLTDLQPADAAAPATAEDATLTEPAPSETDGD